jgi:uncharacterized SAM-binding protein YcdF (DUF218 family)
MSNKKPKKNMLLQRFFTFLCSLAIIWAGGYMYFLTLVTDYKKEERYAGTDAIIVVTGGAGRIHAGLELLNSGKARNLFISGVDERVTEADIKTMWKGKNPQRECCISLDYKATNTRENAIETAKWVEEKGHLSLVLVTSNYHMPRARMEFNYSMPNIRMSYYPVNAPDIDKSFSDFLFIVFSEYNKLLLTFLRHNIG